MKVSTRNRNPLCQLAGLCPAALRPARWWRGKPSGFLCLWSRLGALAAASIALLLLVAGCQSGPPLAKSEDPGGFSAATTQWSPNKTNAPAADLLVLHEGDTVRISFPGSPSLNTVQQIRRDGKISLALVGEVIAAGLTPSQLEKELSKVYGPQLVDKEVNVILESSAFQVFVTGAVSRPGRLVSDRPLTALEAVIDAGVDLQKANLKAVSVIRRENGQQLVHVLNLKEALQGGGQPFYLKPSDIIFVREKFTWF